MASSLTTPETYLGWFRSGDDLILLTSSSGSWAAIDETVSDGILVHYFGEPDPIPYDQPEQYPDIDPSLHSALVDYIKGKLFLDEAGKFAELPETAATYLALSRTHMNIWKDMVNRRLPSLTTKIAGPRYMVPLSLRE